MLEKKPIITGIEVSRYGRYWSRNDRVDSHIHRAQVYNCGSISKGLNFENAKSQSQWEDLVESDILASIFNKRWLK